MTRPWHEEWVMSEMLEGESIHTEQRSPWGPYLVVMVTCSGRRVVVADSSELGNDFNPDALAALAVAGMWKARTEKTVAR